MLKRDIPLKLRIVCCLIKTFFFWNFYRQGCETCVADVTRVVNAYHHQDFIDFWETHLEGQAFCKNPDSWTWFYWWTNPGVWWKCQTIHRSCLLCSWRSLNPWSSSNLYWFVWMPRWSSNSSSSFYSSSFNQTSSIKLALHCRTLIHPKSKL